MNNGDLISVTLKGQMFNQEVVNQFFYLPQIITGTGFNGSEALSLFLNEFNGVFVDVLIGITSDNVTYSELEAINLWSQTELASLAVNKVGQAPGTPMPSFVAFNYRTQRARRDVRRGFKRFVGVTEGQTTGNQISLPSDPSYLAVSTALNSAINLQAADLSYEIDFVPAIINRIKYPVVLPNGQVVERYRLPLDASELKSFVPVYQLQPDITTQSSRKAGRGS